MELERALDQISEIRDHLARGEVYRGYRSIPVGGAGLLAIAASVLQAMFWRAADDVAFIRYWIGVAIIGAAVSSCELAYRTIFRDAAPARWKTWRVLGQFAPSVVAAAAITAAAVAERESLRWIPATWTLLFSVGLLATRPYMPRAVGWIGLYYLIAGTALLASGSGLSPWPIGLVFGCGQLALAVVLYWNIERVDAHGC